MKKAPKRQKRGKVGIPAPERKKPVNKTAERILKAKAKREEQLAREAKIKADRAEMEFEWAKQERAEETKPAPVLKPDTAGYPELEPKQRAFLSIFAITGNVGRTADAIGVARTSHYRWLESGVYKLAFQEAREQAAELLQDEAVRRAHDGVLKPVFQGGVRVGVVREYSDTLMITLLKGLLPETFTDRMKIDWDGDFSKLPPSKVQKMIPYFEAMAERARARAADAA